MFDIFNIMDNRRFDFIAVPDRLAIIAANKPSHKRTPLDRLAQANQARRSIISKFNRSGI